MVRKLCKRCCAVLCSPVLCSVLRENLCGRWTNGAGGRARHLLSMSPDLRLGGGVATFGLRWGGKIGD